MKAVVIGESSGATMEQIIAVYPRHKAIVDAFVAEVMSSASAHSADRDAATWRSSGREAAEARQQDPFILEGLVKASRDSRLERRDASLRSTMSIESSRGLGRTERVGASRGSLWIRWSGRCSLATTGELDDAAARLFAAHGARSAPPSPTGFRERSSSASTTKSFMAFPGLAKSPAATSSNSTSRWKKAAMSPMRRAASSSAPPVRPHTRWPPAPRQRFAQHWPSRARACA